jgi:hypothetical protein
MKVDFPTLEPGSRLVLHISNASNSMEMGASILRHLKENIAQIELDHSTGRTLTFENVNINIIYTNNAGIPYIWINSTIVTYQGKYLLQVKPDGGRRYNRRSSFRVGVSHGARLRISGHGEIDTTVRDISLSGFSITDRRKELNLSSGSHAYVRFEDLGQQLELEGNVIRIEETEEYIVYGFVITKSCRDLSTYVMLKQRQKRT